MDLVVKTFDELLPTEVYSLLQLRSEIFVVEQQCVYQDMDGKDNAALHVLGWSGNELVAYSRIFGPGDYFPQASIGRVAVRQSHRGKGIGLLVMKKSIEAVQTRFGSTDIALSAQSYLKDFYTDLGFIPQGNEYLEDGIPHIKMVMPSLEK